MKGSIGQKSRIREGPSIRIWSHAVALVHIEGHRGAFRTHPVAYWFIETRLAGRMCVDPGGFASIWMLWQVPSEKHCGRMRPDVPGSRESLWDAAWCAGFLPYKDVIQVEFKSTQRNRVFCPTVPLKILSSCHAWIAWTNLQKEKICQY